MCLWILLENVAGSSRENPNLREKPDQVLDRYVTNTSIKLALELRDEG